MIDVQTFILSLISTGILTPTISWQFLNRLIDNRMTRELEKYKYELQREAQEHDVRFRDLHAKRAEVIVKMHELLQNYFMALESFTALLEIQQEPNKDEKFEDLVEINKNLTEYFLTSRIFLSEDMDANVESLLKDMRSVARDFKRELSEESPTIRNNDIAERIRIKIKPILLDLRSDFRVTLGVKKPTKC